MALDTASIKIAAKIAGEEAVRSLARQLSITEKEAKQLIRTNLQLGSSGKAAASGMTGAAGAASTAARSFALARGAAAALAATLAPLAAITGLGSLAKLGMDAETAEAKLRTMSGSIKDFDQLAPLLQQVARETGNTVGPTEMASAAYEVLSAGATSAADAAAKLKAGLILAKGGAVDASTAVDGLTSIMNAYAVDTSRATEVADKIRKTVDDGKITFEQYSTTIGRAAAVAAGAGVSLDELNAAIGTVTSGGIVAETAISGVRQLIVNLVKPTDDAKQVAKAYGIELGAAALRAKGLGGVLDDVRIKTGGNAQAVSKLITDVDGLTAAQALFVKDGQKYKDLLDNQTTSAGTAAKAADIMAQTTEESVKRMKSAWESLAKRLVEAMQPTFTWLADRFTELFTSIEQAFSIRPLTPEQLKQIDRQAEQMAARRYPSGRKTPRLPQWNEKTNRFDWAERDILSDRAQQEYHIIREQLIRDAMRVNRQQAAGQGRRNMGTYVVNGITYDAATGRPVGHGGPYQRLDGRQQSNDSLPPEITGDKPRTEEEITRSISALNRTAQIQALQKARIGATEYTKAMLDYQIAIRQADEKLVGFMQQQGVTAKEVAAATQLKAAEVDTAKATLADALKGIAASLDDLGTRSNEVVKAYNEAFNPAALIEPDGNSFEEKVRARTEAITETVRDSVARLEDLLKQVERNGSPAAAALKAGILARLNGIPTKDGSPAGPKEEGLRQVLAEPERARGYALAQVSAASAAAIALDQGRQLQQLQDQLQALLNPYGELTAQQQLENRLTREGIELSASKRAERFADARAIDETTQVLRRLNEQQQLSRQLADNITGSFREAFKGLLFQAQSLEEALSNVFGRLADQLFDLSFNLIAFGNPFGFSGSIFGQVLPGFQARAAGGPVSAGSPYIVGERGPELFVPRSSGTIVPNGAAGGVVNNISIAVDAKGSTVQGDAGQGQQLARVVSAAVTAELLRQQRPGGILSGTRR